MHLWFKLSIYGKWGWCTQGPHTTAAGSAMVAGQCRSASSPSHQTLVWVVKLRFEVLHTAQVYILASRSPVNLCQEYLSYHM